MSDSIRSVHGHARREQGFTLIEVLIAIVVLVFGLIAITNLFLVAGSSNTVANQATAAADMAAQALENLKAQPFNSGQLNTGGSLAADTSGYFRNDQLPGVGTINTRWTVTNVDVRTKFIRVRAEGQGVLARGRSRAEFTTYRTCTTPVLGCP
jgi:prepilin-type N-terminal cleavage/methylation domain-containing protein